MPRRAVRSNSGTPCRPESRSCAASGYSSRIVRTSVPPISSRSGLSGRAVGPGATVNSPSWWTVCASGMTCAKLLRKIRDRPDRRRLDPAASGVGDQGVHVPLSRRDHLLARGPRRRQVGVPKLRRVAEEFSAGHVRGDRVALAVPEHRRLPPHALEPEVQKRRRRAAADADAVELQLGELVEEGAVVGHAPAFHAHRKIAHRLEPTHRERRLEHLVDFRQRELPPLSGKTSPPSR